MTEQKGKKVLEIKIPFPSLEIVASSFADRNGLQMPKIVNAQQTDGNILFFDQSNIVFLTTDNPYEEQWDRFVELDSILRHNTILDHSKLEFPKGGDGSSGHFRRKRMYLLGGILENEEAAMAAEMTFTQNYRGETWPLRYVKIGEPIIDIKRIDDDKHWFLTNPIKSDKKE
tara:strand:- start:50 stop:565 length:516 start_codon:yes stop_codon:yes gene_type:complete